MQNIKQIILLTHLLIGTFAFAQAPEKMSYQAIVRNASNNLVVSQNVGMRISILQGTSTGTAVYVETQTRTTNANGLVTLEIGGGTVVTGTFASINWANALYFIKTETDPAGGTNYTITGTSQLLSSPYALHAKTAQNGLPTGGTANQVLAKVDGTNYNTQWVTPSADGGIQLLNGATATTFNFTSTTARNYIVDCNNNTTTLRPAGAWTATVSIPSASSFPAGAVINLSFVGNVSSPTLNLTSSGCTISAFNNANVTTYSLQASIFSFMSDGNNRWFRI